MPKTTPPPEPATRRVLTDFDWVVYADATFAGLSILIPIPFVDSLLETYFRRRMPRDIARRRGRTLSPAVTRLVNRQRGRGVLAGCLMLPVDLIIHILRNLYRTVLYVLSVVDASEKLSYYWHRAFLLDYSIGRGHLDNVERAAIAGQTIQQLLETTQTSPMINLAAQIIETARRQIRSLLRAIIRFVRRQEETQGVKNTRHTIAAQWAEFHDYLLELADRYDAIYAAIEMEQAAAQATGASPTN